MNKLGVHYQNENSSKEQFLLESISVEIMIAQGFANNHTEDKGANGHEEDESDQLGLSCSIH